MQSNRGNRLVALLVGAAASALVAGAATAQDACTEMQVFLSISPAHRDNVMSYIAPKLKEEMGVTLVAEEIGSANMVERLSAQMPNPRVTIAQWDVPIGVSACADGMCAPIDLSKAPNAGKLFDWAYTKDGDDVVVLATNVLGVGLLYNEEALKEAGIEPPTSWTDLADPSFAGRISITAPASTWGTAQLVKWAQMGGGGVDNIDPGFEFAESLMDNMHTVHTWSSEMSNLMQLGEVWLSTTGSNMGAALRAKGLPVRWVLPEEGSPVAAGGLSFVKGAPCTEAAYRYLDLYYSDEFQLLRVKDGGLASPSPTAWDKIPDETKADMDLTSKEFDKLEALDWKAINAVRPEWIERWNREIR
ncbi:ABC transporter substrate-binding protein [Acuticoccus mangrovi]|uniref:Extracellular solute-binding protein n=1 Tax=Acuticoccus mangrovi TaxID=2796142 RepID=A0A934IRZ0_9HYPH|nr:extracellular solute-binding protein [Acuticoccus mangrovi]MBJ3776574.1 extracellular solute-binding protein [Acuticoccus mangrovi]